MIKQSWLNRCSSDPRPDVVFLVVDVVLEAGHAQQVAASGMPPAPALQQTKTRASPCRVTLSTKTTKLKPIHPERMLMRSWNISKPLQQITNLKTQHVQKRRCESKGVCETYRYPSFIEVGKTLLQLCVQNLLRNNDEPRQAVRKQRERLWLVFFMLKTHIRERISTAWGAVCLSVCVSSSLVFTVLSVCTACGFTCSTFRSGRWRSWPSSSWRRSAPAPAPSPRRIQTSSCGSLGGGCLGTASSLEEEKWFKHKVWIFY